MGEERKVYRVLVGRPEGKSPLGRPRRRWEDGTRINPIDPWFENRSGHFSSILMNWEFRTLIQFIY
jgi:hypothetical protein